MVPQTSGKLDVEKVLALPLEEITLEKLKQGGFDFSPDAMVGHREDIATEEYFDDVFRTDELAPASDVGKKIAVLKAILASL